MSAAAAAPVPQLRPKRGYTSFPDWWYRKVPKRVGAGVQYILLEIIYVHTISWNREAAVIPMATFTDWTGCGEERVRQALRYLEKLEVVSSEEAGRNRKYKLDLKKLEGLEEKPQRVHSRVVELPKRERHEFRVTREQPHKIGEIIFKAPQEPVAVQTVSDGNGELREVILLPSAPPDAARPSDRVHPAASSNVSPIRRDGEQTDNPNYFGVLSNGGPSTDTPNILGVSKFVNSTLKTFWRKGPDADLVQRVLRAMGETPLPWLEQQVEIKKPKLRELKPGILIWCAEEAAKSYRAHLEEERPRLEAEARQRRALERCTEPEHSDSPWAQLRAAIRRKLSPDYAEYDGLECTAFHRIVDGVMEVLAPDAKHAAALVEWHGELLAAHNVRVIPLQELQ